MNGAGYDVPAGGCHYKVSFGRFCPASVGEKCDMAFSFHIRFFPVTYLCEVG